MQTYSRREILKMGAALAAGTSLGGNATEVMAKGLDSIFTGEAKVVWLQGLSCTGCSISFINADEPGPLDILTQVISLVYHPNISAAQGDVAMGVLDTMAGEKGYLVVVEGSVPMGMSQACMIGGKTFSAVLEPLLRGAAGIIAAGTCSSFGGIPSAEGNVTGSASLQEYMQANNIPVAKRLINCPGCPSHPQSLLGVVAYVLAAGYPDVDAELLTPKMFFANTVHDTCPRFHDWQKNVFAEKFGDDGCLFKLGCLGPLSHTSCLRRQWNGGVNWCIRAGAPCNGCTSKDFARKRDFPFYRKGEAFHKVAYREDDRKGANA